MSAERLFIDARLAFPGFALEVAQPLSLAGCTAVFGPSGGGKSTLLRLIAGLARPDRGRIAIGDTVWCDTARGLFTPAHRRRVGVMFQDGRLFPHLTVEGNLLYADRRSGANAAAYGLPDIIEAFDLAPLLGRRPRSLSGGERQRCALARTLLTRPDLILLDEPLSALDRRRKSEILPYLDDLPARFGAPVIYVSHSVEEVVRLADQAVILAAGRIEAAGPTAQVLNAYGALSGTGAFEAGAIVEGVVAGHDARHLLTRVDIGDGMVSLPMNAHKAPGETVAIRIDARNVAIATSPPADLSIRNVLPATISTVTAHDGSPFVDVTLRGQRAELRAQITRASLEELALTTGREVYALIKSASFDL
ncbi:MAG: molybdenum ABC transporter ATP-binding protein [Caulobacterales bacterium]|nr:molybdenum ABC transporter ATP-binding protein [Caulobacterales bacterium]